MKASQFVKITIHIEETEVHRMILSDSDIKAYLKRQLLNIEPLVEAHIEPASVDLTLGSQFLKPIPPETGVQRMSDPIAYEEIDQSRVVIPAHAFILATTEEYLTLPQQLTGFIEGRSSVGRAGLFIQNAGWVDPGFEGRITLELYNANDFPLEIEQGQRICQIVLAETKTIPERKYQGKYQGQDTTTGSRLFRDWMKDGGD